MSFDGRTKKFFAIAKRVAAKECDTDRVYRHGAVLVKGSTVRSSCANQNKFKGWGNRFRRKNEGYATLHAELGCVLGVDRRDTKNATVYVVRIDAKDDFKLSRPCAMCQAALKHVGIKKVIYSINNEEYGVMKL